MLIDWYTVGAQALNFVILVWLMKRFLYKPILHAIDAREKRIAAELADAAAKEAEASKERDEFQHKNEELDQQRAALLKKATDDANAERQRLLDEARQAANALSAKRQEALRTDAKNLNQAIQRRTQREVFAIARKALTDLATTSLEERLVAVFTRRLRELDGPTKAGLAKALEAASDSALVRSAFELPADQRAVIQNALNETFSADVHVRFETAPDLVSGIELAANGQKVGWSIDGYLASLEKGVDELSEGEGARAEPPSEGSRQSPSGHRSRAKPGAPERRGEEPMSTAPDSLQSVFDDAFAEIAEVRGAFTPRLTLREVGTITSIATGIAKVSGLPGVGFEELVDVSRWRVRHRVQRGRGRDRRRPARRLLASARGRRSRAHGPGHGRGRGRRIGRARHRSARSAARRQGAGGFQRAPAHRAPGCAHHGPRAGHRAAPDRPEGHRRAHSHRARPARADSG